MFASSRISTHKPCFKYDLYIYLYFPVCRVSLPASRTLILVSIFSLFPFCRVSQLSSLALGTVCIFIFTPRLQRVYIFPTLSIRQGLAPSRTLYPAFMFIFAPALVVSIFFMFSYTRLGVHICSRPNFLFSNIIFIYFIFV